MKETSLLRRVILHSGPRQLNVVYGVRSKREREIKHTDNFKPSLDRVCISSIPQSCRWRRSWIGTIVWSTYSIHFCLVPSLPQSLVIAAIAPNLGKSVAPTKFRSQFVTGQSSNFRGIAAGRLLVSLLVCRA